MTTDVPRTQSSEDSSPEAYRQPKGVERYGVEPVPDEQRTVRWYDLFQIIFNVMLNPGLILIGGLAVVSGLSFWAAVAAQVLGVLIAFSAYTVMATVGVDYGLPGIVSTRAFLGITASRWLVSLLRAVSSAFWFAFQTLAGAMGILAVLEAWLGVRPSLIGVSLVFAVLQASVALFGYGSLTWLSKVAFPVKLVILGYLFWLLANHQAPGFAPSEVFSYSGSVGWKWAVFAVWVNAVAAAWFSQVTDAADYCRYSKSRKDMWIGTMAAALLGTAGSAFFGAYAAAASLGRTANAFEVIPGLGVGSVALILVLVVLVLDNWTVNVLNVYTGGLALANLATRLGRFWSTLVVAAAGTALAAFPALIDGFNDSMSAMGNVFAPLVGVLLADYLVIKRGRIDVPALFDPHGPYRYTGGVNVLALAWWALGSIAFFALPETVLPIPFVALASGVGYALTAMVLSARRDGTAPRVDAPGELGQPTGSA
ncbi:purine-cytosine permease family protein [Streptomyces sp. NPDC001750]|uniref:purine-cytosine permease family protein n=1 Tax=unclassified Streptomyces TaxID=2593676 RepID=UPI0036BEDBC0